MTRRRGSMQWMLEAACLDADPEIFFPPGRPARWTSQADEARAVCGGCSVREHCLQLALETDVQFGIWGGYSPLEVARIRRRSGEIRSGSRPWPWPRNAR